MLAMLPFLFHHNNSSLTMEASLRLAQRCGPELDDMLVMAIVVVMVMVMNT